MKAVKLTLFMLGMVLGDLSPPKGPYKILMLLPVGTNSHKVFFTSIAETLAERGHTVVMLTNYPPSSENPNVTELNHGLEDRDINKMNVFDFQDDITGGFYIFEEILPAMARKLYEIPVVKELYAKRRTFDLIIVDQIINEVIYPFLHEQTYVSISAFGMDTCHSAILGNVQNPAYVSAIFQNFPNHMNLRERFLNILHHLYFPLYWRNWAVVPKIQKEISTSFPDLPPLLDIERNVSLSLINTHFAMDGSLPLLPSQVAIGGVHCRSAKPLPEDLEAWITGAGPAGVVYFSLGTVTRGCSIPAVTRNMFIEAFKKLNQRILWKYDGSLEGISDNVLLRKWLPQQDVLGHPNVRVFLTHAGRLSTLEAAYHATPVVALPIVMDQPQNARKMKRIGMGITLEWDELSVDTIVSSIQEVLENPKYKASVEDVSRKLRDQPQSPQDLTVFWIEYVIRNRGAPSLRSPAAKLSWVEYLLLDVVGALVFGWILLSRVIRCLWWGIVFSWDHARKKKKKKRE